MKKDLYLSTKTREGSDLLKVRTKYRQKTRRQFNGLIIQKVTTVRDWFSDIFRNKNYD
jgi:hypothetical protein